MLLPGFKKVPLIKLNLLTYQRLCSLLCRGVKTSAVCRGMSVVAPNAYEIHNRFTANMYLLNRGEGGRKRPISTKYIMPLFAKTWNLPCRIDVKDGGMLMPGKFDGALYCSCPLLRLKLPLIASGSSRSMSHLCCDS